MDDRERVLRDAIAAEPAEPRHHVALGDLLRELRRPAEALASYDRALALDPDHVAALGNRGPLLADLGRAEEALASYDRALALEPDHAGLHANKGSLLTELGRFASAVDALTRAISLAPRQARYHFYRSTAWRFTPGDDFLQAMEELARDLASLADEQSVFLHFALGKAYADIGDIERSFRHLAEGNRLKRSQIVYNEAVTLRVFDHMRAVFDADLMRRHASAGDPSSLPVFILGMPRSGSSLVEQIIASHPAVFGAGEIDDFERALARISADERRTGQTFALTDTQVRDLGAIYLARIRGLAPAAARIVNKAPQNFSFIGFIHLALPNARIIHTIRDPLDTCLSCFSQLFQHLPYTYSLAELGRYYRAYERMMAHWRTVLPPGVMLDVRYEELVADLEGQARRIVDHCGVAWDPRCLEFQQTERLVRTASKTQVRQMIHQSSVGRWEALRPRLGPLLAELEDGTR